MSYLLSLGAGAVLGICFALLNLPIPAPPKLQGILGILGITLGYMFINAVKK